MEVDAVIASNKIRPRIEVKPAAPSDTSFALQAYRLKPPSRSQVQRPRTARNTKRAMATSGSASPMALASGQPPRA